MNTLVAAAFKNLLRKYFDLKSEKINWADLKLDWSQRVELNAHLISNEDRKLLSSILDEVEDILTHMPGLKGAADKIDWSQWTDDDEFLNYLITREALGFPLDQEGYSRALQDSVKSGYFKRPYLDNDKFISEIYRYLKDFIMSSNIKKYRLVRFVQLHPDGEKKEIISSNLTIEAALNELISLMDSSAYPHQLPCFEEDT